MRDGLESYSGGGIVNNEKVAVLVVAAVCLFVVGSSAASLESSVDSSPSDAIDVDYSMLPFGPGDATDIKEQYTTTGEGSETGAQREQSAASGDSAQQQEPAEDSSTNSGSANEGSTGADSEGAGEETTRTGSGVVDDLLAFLLSLLDLALTVLAVCVLAAVLAVGWRFRDRLGSRIRSAFVRVGLVDETTRPSDQRETPRPEPENVVERAWLEMVDQTGVDASRSLTPRERAKLVRERGVDASVAWSITELFEEVTYGGAPLTDERRRRARSQVERLRRQAGENRT